MILVLFCFLGLVEIDEISIHLKVKGEGIVIPLNG